MWPFSRRSAQSGVTVADDVFWLQDSARVGGVIAAASQALQSGSHVLVVTHIPRRVEHMADAATRAGLALDGIPSPMTAVELSGRMRAQPAPCIFLTLASMLSPSLHRTESQRPQNVIVLVADRYPLRTQDDAIVSFAESLHAAQIVFHSCIKDPLFAVFRGDQTEKILRAMGMKDNDPLSHPMLARSVRRAQEKLAKRCRDHAQVESWLASQTHQ